MGCGKSSVGRELSKLLCCPFMDLDSVIEERAGRSIPEIFSTNGEAAFRRMELEVLKDIAVPDFSGSDNQDDASRSLKENTSSHDSSPSLDSIQASKLLQKEGDRDVAVLALGGGAVMTKECAEMVHEKTLCIYLRASVETLLSHLADEADGRPMLRTSSKNGNSGTSLPESAETSSREAKQESSSTESLKHMRKNLQTRIEELMSMRSATYESTAHIIIDTDGKSVKEIAWEIHRNLDKIS